MMARRNAALPFLPAETGKNDKVYGPKVLLTPPETAACEDISEREPESVERYKLVVVGDEECGKTALLNALVKNADFEVDDSFATFDECVTDIKTPHERVEFTLYEVTGMDNYRSFRIELYRGADVFLVCFDIGRPSTLRSVIHKWSSEISYEFPEVPFLLIGCKNDLRTDSAVVNDTAEEAESVSRFKAETVARSIGAKAYIECCAKTRWNVNHVFKGAAEAILSKDEGKVDLNKYNSVLRRFSRLTSSERNHNLKRGSIFSFVVDSNA